MGGEGKSLRHDAVLGNFCPILLEALLLIWVLDKQNRQVRRLELKQYMSITIRCIENEENDRRSERNLCNCVKKPEKIQDFNIDCVHCDDHFLRFRFISAVHMIYFIYH